jgi:uncharacterized protein YcbK (DUF882 family)
MKYFTLDELTVSDTAQRKGIDNTPDAIAVANLKALVENILDPLRSAYGRPITVTSGYRSNRLNTAVGGAVGSQHMSGQAADITVGTAAQNKALYELIQRLKLPYDQLISAKYKYGWVHVSYDPKRNRRQVF